MQLFSIESLSFKYGDKPVLKGVSLEVHSGDFIGILGPNGSGKTTLLKCISGVLKPDRGKIFFENKLLQELSAREIAQAIAVVPQITETGFDFSVSQFVGMGRTPYIRFLKGETQQDHAAIQNAMELTGVHCLADRSFRDLSGGERQRVVIAQALAQQPRVLLLDEPASFLDISHEIEVFDLIRELNLLQKITVIVVLHDLNLASRYCDSLVMLHQGEVFAQGSPEEILTPENIRQVYQAEVQILRSNGIKYIIPLKSVEEEATCQDGTG